MKTTSFAPFGALFVLLALSVNGCSSPLDDPTAKSDASLSAIAVDFGTLEPDFSPTTLFYTLDLANDVSKLTVTGTATRSISTVTNPTAETSLTVGTTQVLEVSVLAADQKTTMVYQVSVTRAALPVVVTPTDPADATLKSLSVYIGTLSPAFDPLVTDYRVNLPYEVTKFSANGVATHPGAVVTNPLFQNGLEAGATVVLEVSVLAADQKTTEVYRISVSRDKAMAANVLVSAGTLTPAFSPTVHDYQVTVPNSVTSVTVTGTPSDQTASVTGPDVLTGLVVGQPQASTLTFSRAGVTADYRISVTRSALPAALNLALTGDDASLFKLSLTSAGSSSQSQVQSAPANWIVDLANSTQGCQIDAFIDANNDNVLDAGELRVRCWYTLTAGQTLSPTIQLGKTVLSVAATGDASIFAHPMFVNNRVDRVSSSQVVAPISATSMVVYTDLASTYSMPGYLAVFDDLNNNQRYDLHEPTISTAEVTWNYGPAVTAALTLMATPPQQLGTGKYVEVMPVSQFYPQDTLHYRFMFNAEWNSFFFMYPEGSGTDSAFLNAADVDNFWQLLVLAYSNDNVKVTQAQTNSDQQLVAWKQNIKDAVTYLESVRGLTVYGKELLPSDW